MVVVLDRVDVSNVELPMAELAAVQEVLSRSERLGPIPLSSTVSWTAKEQGADGLRLKLEPRFGWVPNEVLGSSFLFCS